MRERLICLLISLAFIPSIQATHVLEGLNFSSGEWALIGVPVHNYKNLPVQEELGTFICEDVNLMHSLQQEWDLDMTFDDKCDYHYALKFYRNGELVRTLDLNLYCGYITFDGLSYGFAPQQFERIRQQARQVAWSRISFSDISLLKKAINTLQESQEVYWYEDVNQYTYPGFFMLSLNHLPWDTDRDSLKQVVAQKIERRVHSQDFYLQEYYYIIRGDKMFVRYIVNCEESLSESLEGLHMGWRSHMRDGKIVSILAIGIDEEDYREMMGQR